MRLFRADLKSCGMVASLIRSTNSKIAKEITKFRLVATGRTLVSNDILMSKGKPLIFNSFEKQIRVK